MTSLEKLLIILSAASFILALVLFIRYRSVKKQTRNLTASIEKYIETGKITKLSLKDGDFSLLQNAICDLENAFEKEKQNSEIQIKTNHDFLMDISHQFKTPLAGLRLYTELDINNGENLHKDKEIQLIDKMETLIESLLTLEKLRQESYQLDFSDCEISGMLQDICSELKVIFPKKSLNISGNARIRCDSRWLGEALGNIIKNSCEHTPKNGFVNIDIRKDEFFATITVTDNGGGVSEEDTARLFNRFHRAKSASAKSVGLGLAITKTVIEKHHGNIYAENVSDGLKISISLPLIEGNRSI